MFYSARILGLVLLMRCYCAEQGGCRQSSAMVVTSDTKI